MWRNSQVVEALAVKDLGFRSLGFRLSGAIANSLSRRA